MQTDLDIAVAALLADQFDHGEWGRCEGESNRTLDASRCKPKLFTSTEAALSLVAAGKMDCDAVRNYLSWIRRLQQSQGWWLSAAGTSAPGLATSGWVKNVRHTAKALDVLALADMLSGPEFQTVDAVLTNQLEGGAYPQFLGGEPDIWSTLYAINLALRLLSAERLLRTSAPVGVAVSDWELSIRSHLERARCWVIAQLIDHERWSTLKGGPSEWWVTAAVAIEAGADLANARPDICRRVADYLLRSCPSRGEPQILWSLLAMWSALSDAQQNLTQSALSQLRTEADTTTLAMACRCRLLALRGNMSILQCSFGATLNHSSALREWKGWYANHEVREVADAHCIASVTTTENSLPSDLAASALVDQRAEPAQSSTANEETLTDSSVTHGNRRDLNELPLWDFFLAHAGPDLQPAELLYDALSPECRVFLDSKCLRLGDDWDTELSAAQRRSAITVVLVSNNTTSAYYQREEVAAAIAQAREDGRRHRVVPIYLPKVDRAASHVPYGLRLKHGISLQSLSDLRGAANQLIQLNYSLQPNAPSTAQDLLNVSQNCRTTLSSATLGTVTESRASSVTAAGLAAVGAGVRAARPVTNARVFFSYCRQDRRHARQLKSHLALLERREVVCMWRDREILPSVEWASEVDERLESADIILILISSDFLASDYCYGKELIRALERDRAKEARVVPIILRPAYMKDAPFMHLRALPKDAKPVTKWSNRDEAWANVVEGIAETVEELRGSHRPDTAAAVPIGSSFPVAAVAGSACAPLALPFALVAGGIAWLAGRRGAEKVCDTESSEELRSPTIGSLRRLLCEIMPDASFDRFCEQQFPEIYRSYTAKMSHSQKLTLLLSLCAPPTILRELGRSPSQLTARQMQLIEYT